MNEPRITDMGREYERLFGALPGVETPAYLCERVLGAITGERLRLWRRRLVFSSCAGVLSAIGVAYTGVRLTAALHATGFTSYASLLLSDGAAMAGTKAFFYTLLESLPGIETMALLLALAILIESVRVALSSYTLSHKEPARA